jgi:PAS domain S-box-containing protein
MVNPMMCKMFGYTEKELLNLSIQDLTHPEDIDRDMQLIEKLTSGEIPFFTIEKRYLNKDQEILWGDLTASIIKGNDGKPLYGIGMIADRTERKIAELKLKESDEKLKQLNKELEQRIEDRAMELRDSEIKYRALFEQAGDMIIVIDTENGKIVDFNDKMHENLGYTREEFNNIRVTDFDIMEEDEDYQAHIEKIINQGLDIFESKYRTKSGEVRDILIHAKAIKFKEKTYLHSILRDITDMKEMDKKLKESEEKYRKAYYQANLYRDIFAHDINNILQNIHSSAELSSLYLNNPAKLHTISELYEIIREQVERGRKLIKNVRKINEIDDSEIELERIEAIQFLKNAVIFLRNSFQARILDIKIKNQEKKVFVLANNLLLDVFENILINAVRHNNSTKIEISVEISKEKIEEKKYFRMEFKDNGLGISDYRKKSIFEKGTRKSQRSKGMGLGLSLVKKILDSYRGDIWVEDRVKGEHKEGSKFVILLQEA